MTTYDTAETIIGFAVKTTLNVAIGGPTSVVTGYHETHFKVLARALQESSRDADIQKSLEEIRKNLKSMKDSGARIISKIPAKPEAPSAAVTDLLDPVKNKAYAKEVKVFSAGVTNELEALSAWIKAAEDMVKRTSGELAKIEKNLNMHKARWPALRQISNASRFQEIQFIKIQEMDALSKQLATVKALHAAYDRF